MVVDIAMPKTLLDLSFVKGEFSEGVAICEEIYVHMCKKYVDETSSNQLKLMPA